MLTTYNIPTFAPHPPIASANATRPGVENKWVVGIRFLLDSVHICPPVHPVGNPIRLCGGNPVILRTDRLCRLLHLFGLRPVAPTYSYFHIFLARVLEPTANPDQFSSCVHISFSALFSRPNRISSAKWCNEHTVTNEYNSVVEVHGLERATALNIQWRANQQRTRCEEHEMRETKRVANLSPLAGGGW